MQNVRKQSASVEIWVSQRDGSKLHPIGSQEVEVNKYGWDRDHPMQLSWLPDGKRLSYIYQGQFYTVPTGSLATQVGIIQAYSISNSQNFITVYMTSDPVVIDWYAVQ